MAVAEAIRPAANLTLDRVEAFEDPEAFTEDDLIQFVQSHPDLRVELTKEGELVIMPPTFPETGKRNFKLIVRFGIWSEANDLGIGYDSSTEFTLPNGAKRSPDLAWVEASRWNALTDEERKGFSRVCPDFVVELRSQTDRLSAVQQKMREYVENGARLGWLIDPVSRRVEIYRPGQEAEVLDNPASLSGEDVLPGFTLDLKGILEG